MGIEEQQKYFQEKKERKRREKKEANEKKRAKAKKAGQYTPDCSDSDASPPESEEELGEDDIEEEVNAKLDETMTAYIEAVAAKLTDIDEQMRLIAIESLK